MHQGETCAEVVLQCCSCFFRWVMNCERIKKITSLGHEKEMI